jgi:Uma2 family endonuclease
LIFSIDDAIVVVKRTLMSDSLTTRDYLSGREDLRRRELVWGIVREPPAPRFGHQAVVTRITVVLDQHVRAGRLGVVVVSPIDVVLDEANALVVQPDVIFIAKDRVHIIRDQVWGAPDLVVEVASRGTAALDRTTKLEWYRAYGVRECWLVEPRRRQLTVVNLARGARLEQRFTDEQVVKSAVLPDLMLKAREIFS